MPENSTATPVTKQLAYTKPVALGSGLYTFRFSLWTAETDGSQIWSEEQDLVLGMPVINTCLGRVTALTGADFSQQFWVQVEQKIDIDSYVVLGPRDILKVSPYALWSAIGTDSTKVAKAGDTMTGGLVLPANGLTVGGTQLALASGNVGINASSPAVKLAVNGNGADIYATDVWVERNMHVQGNEELVVKKGDKGRLRVGTAWGYMGIFADQSSSSTANDLVLGASSGVVRIGPDGTGQSLKVNGDLTVAGNLNVVGKQNLIKTYTTTITIQNNGNSPRDTAVDYSSQGFKEVYSCVAMLSGFCLVTPTSLADWDNVAARHWKQVESIPQHVYVRVAAYDTTKAQIKSFCSESWANYEGDNAVLATVLVVGR